MQPNMSLAAADVSEQPNDGAAPEAAPEGSRPGLVAPMRRGRSSMFVGEIVVDLGYADRESVDEAVAESRNTGRNTGTVLVERGILSPYQLARVIAERFGVDFVDLGDFTVDHSAASLISPDTARRYEAVPIAFADENTLLLATPDPANVLALDDIAMMTALEVRPVVASREELAALIARLGRLGEVMDATEDDEASLSVGDVRDEVDEAPIVKLVHSIIAEAAELGASDVHFAPNSGELAVQYRIDGGAVGHLGHPREDGARRRLAREDHGQPRHRRTAPAAGRPHDAGDRRPPDRHARRRRCRSSAASPSCCASWTTAAA